MTRNLPFSSRRWFCILTTNSNFLLGEQGQRHLPVCSKKESRLTLPYMKYFEILTHHYVWSNKEFQEFPTSFASSKTLHFIRRLFGILTSDAGIFGLRTKTEMLRWSSPLKENKKNTIGWGLMDPINWNYTRKFEPLLFFWLPLAICTRGHTRN